MEKDFATGSLSYDLVQVMLTPGPKLIRHLRYKTKKSETKLSSPHVWFFVYLKTTNLDQRTMDRLMHQPKVLMAISSSPQAGLIKP